MMSYEEAMQLIDEIQSMSEDVPPAGQDFAESVREKSAAIGETIEKYGRVTDAQLTALRNMRNGLARWVHE